MAAEAKVPGLVTRVTKIYELAGIGALIPTMHAYPVKGQLELIVGGQ